ncbi:hypothetical protein X975_14511, partial [Stegodyphus mimosarum]
MDVCACGMEAFETCPAISTLKSLLRGKDRYKIHIFFQDFLGSVTSNQIIYNRIWVYIECGFIFKFISFLIQHFSFIYLWHSHVLTFYIVMAATGFDNHMPYISSK